MCKEFRHTDIPADGHAYQGGAMASGVKLKETTMPTVIGLIMLVPLLLLS